jgi:hypothetical protein
MQDSPIKPANAPTEAAGGTSCGSLKDDTTLKNRKTK